jgi:hypothetical protein
MATNTPTQGNDQHIFHMPTVTRGDNGEGVPGNTCGACHTERNVTLGEKASYESIPGNLRWGLAPIGMARQVDGRNSRTAQGYGPNGGRDLALLQEHLAKDDLVAWG